MYGKRDPFVQTECRNEIGIERCVARNAAVGVGQFRAEASWADPICIRVTQLFVLINTHTTAICMSPQVTAVALYSSLVSFHWPVAHCTRILDRSRV